MNVEVNEDQSEQKKLNMYLLSDSLLEIIKYEPTKLEAKLFDEGTVKICIDACLTHCLKQILCSYQLLRLSFRTSFN